MSAKHLARPALLDKPNPWLLTVQGAESSQAWPSQPQGSLKVKYQGLRVATLPRFSSTVTMSTRPMPGVAPPAPTRCPHLQSTLKVCLGLHQQAAILQFKCRLYSDSCPCFLFIFVHFLFLYYYIFIFNIPISIPVSLPESLLILKL